MDVQLNAVYSDLPLFSLPANDEADAYVSTHVGNIPVSTMGLTLVHEHVFNRFPSYKKAENEAFTLLQLSALRKHGVETIVDLTPYTSLKPYARVLEQSSVRIVCCIGFYLLPYLPHAYARSSTQELVKKLGVEIRTGRKGTNIRPGVIKVAGQGEIMTPLECRLFDAAAFLQAEHGLPIATHSPKGAIAHLKRLIAAGSSPQHVYVSHLDRGLSARAEAYHTRLAEMRATLDLGASVLFSEFGYREDGGSTAASLTLKAIKTLKEQGYLAQLLISADSNWRWRNGRIHLKGDHYQGAPRTYEYVFVQIVPVLERAGFSSNEINVLLRDNPRRLFGSI